MLPVDTLQINYYLSEDLKDFIKRVGNTAEFD